MARIGVRTEVAGSVWKVLKVPGEVVAADEPILLIESMKMEIPVTAPQAGTLVALHAIEGEMVAEGALVAMLEG